MSKKAKKQKKRMIIYILFIAILASFLTTTIYDNWSLILKNRAEQTELELKYESLLQEEQELSNEITKMQDPDYVAKYAREKYGYSKNNEVIIKVEED